MAATFESSVLDVIHAYRNAFLRLDMRLFEDCWLNEPDTTMLYIPQERASPLRGRDQIRDYFRHVEASFKDVSRMEIADIVMRGDERSAVAFFSYDFAAHTPDGEPFEVRGRVSLVLQSTPDGWRIVHYHGSPIGQY